MVLSKHFLSLLISKVLEVLYDEIVITLYIEGKVEPLKSAHVFKVVYSALVPSFGTCHSLSIKMRQDGCIFAHCDIALNPSLSCVLSMALGSFPGVSMHTVGA